MTNLNKILAVHAEANDLLKKHGLAEQGWIFELDTTKRCLGRCFHRDKKITFSHFYLYSPQTQITDTLLHEIAHALAGPGHKHDYVWQAKAREVGATPEACTTEGVNSAEPNYAL